MTEALVSCSERALRRLPGEAGKISIVVIQHLRRDTQLAISQMRLAGLDLALVLGISYSVDSSALADLRGAGVLVEVCAISAMTQRLKSFLHGSEDRSVILVDVGGYGADLVAEAEFARKIVGVVEETNNGLWRYEKSATLVPVVQIARCPNKNPENVEVGEAVVSATIKVLQALQRDSSDERFAVFGYGGIGENVMASLARRGLDGAIFDTNPARRMLGHVRGFPAPGRQALLSNASVIIGCSGQPSIFASDAHILRTDTLLVSGSSKRIEFSEYVASHPFSDMVCELGFASETDGQIILINRGEPINFVFGSLSPEIGDFQFANIIGGIEFLLDGLPAAGVHELPGHLQSKIAEDWLTTYLSG